MKKTVSEYRKSVGKILLGSLLLMGFVGLVSCEKDDNPKKPGEGEVDATTRLVNEFVLTYSNTYYLWKDKIDYSGKDPKKITDPFALFDELVYDELDLWSYLTDDAEAMFNSYSGVETSYGYSIVLGKFSNTGNYFAIVKFVYPNSPASNAGIKRGDIILGMNDGDITETNYMQLLYSSNIKLNMGTYDASSGSIGANGTTVSLTAVKLQIDAVNAYTIVERGSHKIGYICYTDYVESSHGKLSNICMEFKSKGVTDLVLDLRYNPGGAANSAAYLSSLLVPREHVANEDIYLNEIWNSELNSYWTGRGEELSDRFNKEALAANLDLDRVFVLTTSGTASASEATIVGCMPYMQVIKIGEKTHGKYCGAILLEPTNSEGNVIEKIKNWAMSLVVYKFANANGFTDFKGGLAPEHEVIDNIIAPYQFGDVNDPHFAKAIELITGEVSSATRSNAHNVLPQYTILDRQSQKMSRKGGFIIY